MTGYISKKAAAQDKLAQPAQEPVTWAGVDFDINTTQPQRPWVGLTDDDCKGMSAGDKLIAVWADRTLKEKNT
jgi:hypothetical protein